MLLRDVSEPQRERTFNFYLIQSFKGKAFRLVKKVSPGRFFAPP
jgi:hypothetical protein